MKYKLAGAAAIAITILVFYNIIFFNEAPDNTMGMIEKMGIWELVFETTITEPTTEINVSGLSVEGSTYLIYFYLQNQHTESAGVDLYMNGDMEKYNYRTEVMRWYKHTSISFDSFIRKFPKFAMAEYSNSGAFTIAIMKKFPGKEPVVNALAQAANNFHSTYSISRGNTEDVHTLTFKSDIQDAIGAGSSLIIFKRNQSPILSEVWREIKEGEL